MMECIVPQNGASGLLPHAHHATLQGAPAFPSLCPNCGQSAAREITYSKVFRRSHDDHDNTPTEYIVSSARVPFCDDCIARHRAQEHKPDWKAMLLTLFSDAEIFGAIFPGLGALFVLNLALRALWHAKFTTMAVELGLAFLFGLIARGQAKLVLDRTAHRRVPPLTEVTEAFDFSDEFSSPFEQPRVEYAMRDARFAAAFNALNRDHEYHQNSPQAQRAQRKVNLTVWAFGVLLVVLALWDAFYG